jgi:adenylate cyclase
VPAAAIRSLGFVLVVDDEEQNRTLLRHPLEARGYEIEEAENGMQALRENRRASARRHPARPDDAANGRLRSLPPVEESDSKTAHIPILMVTALSERGDRLMGIQAGANDFLNKPIDIQDVILRVGNAVYAKHLHDQLQAEQEKSERLLLNILPKTIAERMKNGETNIADSYPDVNGAAADLVGFTSLSAHIDPGRSSSC